MAVFALTTPTIKVGTAWTGTAPGDPGTQTVSGTISASTTISTMVSQIEISINADVLEYTNFGSGGWKQKLPGLKEGTVQLTLNQDFAASQVDALFGLGGTFPPGGTGTYYMDVTATSAARGTTNPSYVLQFYNTTYMPVTGQVGALTVITMPFTITGQVARLTA
jgi:hypothetical protein